MLHKYLWNDRYTIFIEIVNLGTRLSISKEIQRLHLRPLLNDPNIFWLCYFMSISHWFAEGSYNKSWTIFEGFFSDDTLRTNSR